MAIDFHRDGPWDLPEGWVWARLGDVVLPRGEKALPDKNSPFVFVGMDDVPSNSLRIETKGSFKDMKSAGNKFYLGDVLYGRLRPYLNKVVAADFEGVASGEFIVMRPNDGVVAHYLQLWMHSRRFVNDATRDTSGDRPRIDFEKIADLELPLPPTAEQQRIVARINELFTEIADGETALIHVRDDLDTWRRALLKAAVTGELTRECRAAHSSNESGADVLARVAAAKAAFKSSKRSARRFVRDEAFDDALPQLPESWTWSQLGEIGEVVGGVTVDKKRKPVDPVTVPYLRVTNVQRGYLDLSEIKSITVERRVAQALTLKQGDMLLNEGGDRDKIGRGWIWEGQIEGCIHQNHVFRVRLYDPSLSPYFLSHYANEMGRRFFVEKGKQTTNLASISMSKISQLPIPLVPAVELQELMHLLGNSLALTLDVEAQFQAAPTAQTIRQSILKAAFEGRLVQQDPRDEPAERLLARLGENLPAVKSKGRHAGAGARA